MFAATTTDTLSVSDPAALRKAPSSIPSCLDLIHPPTASSWSPDNAFLYISSEHIIHRYEPSSNVLKDIYVHDFMPVSNIVAKDRSTIIFSSEEKIHVLECDSSPRISQTFDSQKTPINSLSLSNDSSLLSSTTAGSVHIYNLSLGSHTILRGLPSQPITTATFHPHSRTRLLVAVGKQLTIYDTTRPSGPSKVIMINESASGDIIAVACSPFSKTLVAVATASGLVGLIDLEKDKALFRTLNLKSSLTTLAFSPEGAAIYAGTQSGKLLLVDLRALDKPPKPLILSENGSSVQTICFQKRAKSNTDGSTKTPASATTLTRKSSTDAVPSVRRAVGGTATARPIAKPLPSPGRPRAATAGRASPAARRAISTAKEQKPTATPAKKPLNKESNVLSPVRDPLGNGRAAKDVIDDLDKLADRRRGKGPASPSKAVKKTIAEFSSQNSRSPLSSTASASKASARPTESENIRKARTLPTSTSTSSAAARKASTASIVASNSHKSPPRRERTLSSASRANSDAISAVSSHARSARTMTGTSPSSVSRPSSSSSRPGSSLTSGTTHDSSPFRSRSRSGTVPRASKTPSPDLPEVQLEPITPVPMPRQKKKGMEVLGLGTPEVDRWFQAGKEDERKSRGVSANSKGKTVGFQDDEESDEGERGRELSLQISPHRPGQDVPSSGSGSTDLWETAAAISNSSNANSNSLGGLSPGNGGSGTAAPSSAHELLRTILQDVMYDFQRETKAEMMGLHLDLLRMGRSWKSELRTLMDDYVGDLRELREENQRLRAENERLRRGY